MWDSCPSHVNTVAHRSTEKEKGSSSEALRARPLLELCITFNHLQAVILLKTPRRMLSFFSLMVWGTIWASHGFWQRIMPEKAKSCARRLKMWLEGIWEMFMEEEQPITSTNIELLEHLFMRGYLPFRFNFDVYSVAISIILSVLCSVHLLSFTIFLLSPLMTPWCGIHMHFPPKTTIYDCRDIIRCMLLTRRSLRVCQTGEVRLHWGERRWTLLCYYVMPKPNCPHPHSLLRPSLSLLLLHELFDSGIFISTTKFPQTITP